MPIVMEFTQPNIYIFRWTGIVRPEDALTKQEEAMQHAAAHNITRQIQIIDMTELEMVAWDIRAFRQIISLNREVCHMYLVQPPKYIQVGAGAIHSFVRFMELDICQTYDEALQKATTAYDED